MRKPTGAETTAGLLGALLSLLTQLVPVFDKVRDDVRDVQRDVAVIQSDVSDLKCGVGLLTKAYRLPAGCAANAQQRTQSAAGEVHP